MCHRRQRPTDRETDAAMPRPLQNPVRSGSNAARSVMITFTPWQVSPANLLAAGVKRIGTKRVPATAAAFKRCSQLPTVYPRRTEHFERRICTAPHGQVRRLEQPDARVEQRFGQRAHVGRRIDPHQTGAIVEVRTAPPFELHDLEIQRQSPYVPIHGRQFTHGHAVPHGKCATAHKRLAARIQHRTGHVDSVDRIRPVQHHKLDLRIGGCLHCVAQRGNIRVEPCADVLDVEHQRVDVLEARRRGLPCRTVQTPDRDTRITVLAVADLRDVQLSLHAMLRAEQRAEFHLGRRE